MNNLNAYQSRLINNSTTTQRKTTDFLNWYYLTSMVTNPDYFRTEAYRAANRYSVEMSTENGTTPRGKIYAKATINIGAYTVKLHAWSRNVESGEREVIVELCDTDGIIEQTSFDETDVDNGVDISRKIHDTMATYIQNALVSVADGDALRSAPRYLFTNWKK